MGNIETNYQKGLFFHLNGGNTHYGVYQHPLSIPHHHLCTIHPSDVYLVMGIYKRALLHPSVWAQVITEQCTGFMVVFHSEHWDTVRATLANKQGASHLISRLIDKYDIAVTEGLTQDEGFRQLAHDTSFYARYAYRRQYGEEYGSR